MKISPKKTKLDTILLAPCLILILSITPYVLSQDEKKEADPWFTEERQQLDNDNSSENGAGVLLGKNKGSRTLYKRVMASYENIAEENITKRISTLEEAIKMAPSLAGEQEIELTKLRALKGSILSDISDASNSNTSIENGLDKLSQSAKYFAYDASLLLNLLDSPFLDRLDSRIRAFGRNGEFDKIAELENQLVSSGLNQVIGERFSSAMRGALSTIIERRWDSSSIDYTPLIGESFLFGRLIGSPGKKLAVQLEFPVNADDKLKGNISKSLERKWGTHFSIASSENNGAAPDLVLEVDARNIETTKKENRSSIASTIPGQVTEEANPEFMAVVQKYEKAAKMYASGMRLYEIEHERYLQYQNEGNAERREAQANLEIAQGAVTRALAAMAGDGGGGGAATDFANASAERALYQGQLNSIPDSTPIVPQKPYPHHLDILDELYLIPSTVITDSESTPYEYTAKELDYSFGSEAKLTLRTPASATLKSEANVRLQQERAWIKNEGIHRNDPTADPGTYSEAELNSALDIFSLEFGTHCSERFGELLKQVASQLNGAKIEKDGISQVLLSLSLAAEQFGSSKYALTNAELRELAEMARSTDVSPKQFRIECLSYILEKSSGTESVSKQALQELL